MAGTEIFTAGMKPPENIDGLSAPPKGFKHYSNENLEWAKTIITANFPAVTNIQVFHENKSDIGGNMIVRFMYHGKLVEFPLSYQEIINTLTNRQHSELAAHIQSLTPVNRGIFNKILQRVEKIENVKRDIHATIENLFEETQGNSFQQETETA